MTHNIEFPLLGLKFDVNTVAFSIGNFHIQWYGVIIAVGFLLAILYSFKSCKKMNINKDGLFDAIIAGLIFGVIGARLYYVIFYPGDRYWQNPVEIFWIRDGGLGIYGGIIGGLLAGAIVAKIRKLKVGAILDVAALGYLIGQGVGRWGNFVNQEAFGYATDLPWGMASETTRLEVVGNVHPCFLYESILCFLGFIVLHLFTRYLRRYDGQTFLLYIAWYGASRFFIEGLRTDSLLVPGLDIRVSQAIAAATVIVALIILIIFARKTSLSGCGSRKIMELNSIVLGLDGSLPQTNETPEESTIFAGRKYNETPKVEEEVKTEKVKMEEAKTAEVKMEEAPVAQPLSQPEEISIEDINIGEDTSPAKEEVDEISIGEDTSPAKEEDEINIEDINIENIEIEDNEPLKEEIKKPISEELNGEINIENIEI